MKVKFLLGFCAGMAFNTIIAGTLGRKEALLYGTLMTISALIIGNEVEKNEE